MAVKFPRAGEARIVYPHEIQSVTEAVWSGDPRAQAVLKALRRLLDATKRPAGKAPACHNCGDVEFADGATPDAMLVVLPSDPKEEGIAVAICSTCLATPGLSEEALVKRMLPDAQEIKR